MIEQKNEHGDRLDGRDRIMNIELEIKQLVGGLSHLKIWYQCVLKGYCCKIFLNK